MTGRVEFDAHARRGALSCMAHLLLLLAGSLAHADDALVELGRALFFDPNLSARRTQSCATCHDPAHAFRDPRDNGTGGALSRGDDGRALGTRNAPSIAYAALVPPFGRTPAGDYVGGLFLDGRAPSLEAQAAEPLVNPREMALPDHAAVVARLRENPHYVATFTALFGADTLADTASGLRALTTALAAFERSPALLAFDSRYDRYLRGEYTLNAAEELGRRLFFSDLTNCMHCHLLAQRSVAAREPFTDHRYHNIGVPANPALGALPADGGLGARADLAAPAARGRFRTPSLRNVAVTAPYMHNGVFRDLATAIKFYNQYIVDNAAVRINPESGRPWLPPEVPETVDRELLRQGQPLDDQRVAALIAFLRTLTDRRYERLLPAAAGDAVAACDPSRAEEACDE